jgi:hypothetical protein
MFFFLLVVFIVSIIMAIIYGRTTFEKAWLGENYLGQIVILLIFISLALYSSNLLFGWMPEELAK